MRKEYSKRILCINLSRIYPFEPRYRWISYGVGSFPFTRLGTHVRQENTAIQQMFSRTYRSFFFRWSFVMSRYHPPLSIRAGRSDLLIYLVIQTTCTRVYIRHQCTLIVDVKSATKSFAPTSPEFFNRKPTSRGMRWTFLSATLRRQCPASAAK